MRRSMNDCESFTHAGLKVRIVYDEDCSSPRQNDNLVTMVCWHDRVNLGDVQRNRHSEDCSAKAIVRELRAKGEKVLAMRPLYLYQHSGMTIRCAPFGDRWDSGQVGWAYVTRTSAEAMRSVGTRYDHVDGKTVAVGTWDKAALEDAIRGEVSKLQRVPHGPVLRVRGRGRGRRRGPGRFRVGGSVGGVDYVRTEAKQAAEYAASDRRGPSPVHARQVEGHGQG